MEIALTFEGDPVEWYSFLHSLQVKAKEVGDMFLSVLFLVRQYTSEEGQMFLSLGGGRNMSPVQADFAVQYLEFAGKQMKKLFGGMKSYDDMICLFLASNPHFEDELKNVKKESMQNLLAIVRYDTELNHASEVYKQCLGVLRGDLEYEAYVHNTKSQMVYMREKEDTMLAISEAECAHALQIITGDSPPLGVIYVHMMTLRGKMSYNAYLHSLHPWKSLDEILDGKECPSIAHLQDLQRDYVDAEVQRYYWERMLERYNVSKAKAFEVYAVGDVVKKECVVFAMLDEKMQGGCE